ncbi:hypothetical protein [Ktedonobacter sp. SOSP1-85]|nr:hypothetical protein [Ktedonobacter sp. SOSP1-85]
MRVDRTVRPEAEMGKETQRSEAADPPLVTSLEQEAEVAPKRLRRYRDE